MDIVQNTMAAAHQYASKIEGVGFSIAREGFLAGVRWAKTAGVPVPQTSHATVDYDPGTMQHFLAGLDVGLEPKDVR